MQGIEDGRAPRDHGTKFQIMLDDLGFLFQKSQRFET